MTKCFTQLKNQKTILKLLCGLFGTKIEERRYDASELLVVGGEFQKAKLLYG